MEYVNDDEEQNLRDALYRSTLDLSKHGQFSKSATKNISPEMELVTLYQSNHLQLLSVPHSDTLVVVGTPPQQSDQSDEAYAPIVRHYAGFHKICSKNVLNLGSAKFDKLFGPTSQYRTERRLKNQGVLPDGKLVDIQYLIDLRPPSEDEEAIFLVTELSCCMGILTWFKAQEKYNIPRTMVCGQDDTSLLPTLQDCPSWARTDYIASKKTPQATPQPHAEFLSTPSRLPRQSSQSNQSEPTRIGNWEGVFPAAPVSPDEAVDNTEITVEAGSSQEASGASVGAVANIASPEEAAIQPEYCQLRHWSAIERLLHAIEGHDPMLDSAPKLWTFFAIAKYFDCASSERISGWITTWLFRAPNHNFIQCNPEVCYRIGLGIQSEALVKNAFSLLVGEKALMNLHREHCRVGSFNPLVSVAGRKLGTLDDDELNRIDHTANIFTLRIQSWYDKLFGEEMSCLDRSSLFEILTKFVPHSSEEEEVARQLKEHIKNFVRSRVIWVLARDYKADVSDFEKAPESVRPFYPHALAQFLTYTELSEKERIFSRFFWIVLRQEQFDLGDNSVFTPHPWDSSLQPISVAPFPGWSKLAKELQTDVSQSRLLLVQKDALYKWSGSFSTILRERYWAALSKAKSESDWSEEESYYLKREHVKRDILETCAEMQASKADADELFGHGLSAVSSKLRYFQNIQLSSQKRCRGISSMIDLADQKRARLDLDDKDGADDQAVGKKFELPIRSAAPYSDSKPAAVLESKTIDVAVLQAVKDPQPLGAQSENVDAEVGVAGGADEPTPKTGAPEDLSPETSERGKKEEQHILELGAEPFFSIDELLGEVTRAMQTICDEVLFAAHFFRDREVPPTDLIGTLMCLTDKEWKYLPLWAGGNDDGSGGVFNDMDVPNFEGEGFNAGGLGEKGKSADAGSSGWSEIMTSVGKASKETIDGTATETATVRSLGDIDMDVKSLGDDDSSVRDTETGVNVDLSAVGNTSGDIQEENEYSDYEEGGEEEGGGEDGGDEEGGDEGVALPFVDSDEDIHEELCERYEKGGDEKGGEEEGGEEEGGDEEGGDEGVALPFVDEEDYKDTHEDLCGWYD